MKFDVIYSDPPWKHNIAGSLKKDNPFYTMNSLRQYDVMTTDQLKGLQVEKVAAENCALYLWVLNGFLPEGLDVMQAWGFRFATIPFIWVKTTNKGNLRNGNGPYTLPGAEICLLGIRGQAKRCVKFYSAIKQVQLAQVEKHSRKPAIFRQLVERLSGPRRLEMYARQATKGWRVFGNQAPGSIVL